MLRTVRSRAAALAVATAVAGALAVPLTAPADASAVVTVKVGSHGKIKLSDTTLHTGAVTFRISGTAPGWSTQVVALKHGLTFKQADKIVGAAFGGKPSAIKQMYADIVFLGGIPETNGATGASEFPKAGTYYFLSSPPGNGEPKLVQLHVSGPSVHPKAPSSPATITAVTGARWGGASTIPTSGTLVFKDVGKDYAHFLSVQAVKPGTTADQILAYLQSPAGQAQDGPPPPWVDMTRPGLDTGIISPGTWMTTKYQLPPGAYAIMCFMPAKDGMPHAAMGMIRVINVA